MTESEDLLIKEQVRENAQIELSIKKSHSDVWRLMHCLKEKGVELTNWTFGKYMVCYRDNALSIVKTSVLLIIGKVYHQ